MFQRVTDPLNTALAVGYVTQELTVTGNTIVGGAPPAEDPTIRRYGLYVYSLGDLDEKATGISVSMHDPGTITVANNQIELYDADWVHGILMFHNLLKDASGESLWADEATVPGLTYVIRGNTIQIHSDKPAEKTTQITAFYSSGPVGSSTSVIGNTIELPEGARVINFPPQFTTLENNAVTWH